MIYSKGQIKSKAIIVLANNLQFFQLFINNIPNTLNDFILIAVNQTRIGDKTKQLNQILNKSIINNYMIIPSQIINNKFKQDVISNQFVDSYCMSMNILSNWYIFKYINDIQKLMFLDDDVIIKNGFQKIFQNNYDMFKYIRLSAGKVNYNDQSKNVRRCFDQFFKIFNIKFSTEWWTNFYLKKYINVGHWYTNKKLFDINNYESKLKLFFQNKVFEQLWNNRKTYASFMFDQKFLFFYFINEINDALRPYTYIITNGPQTFTNLKEIKKLQRHPQYVIIHNATKSRKAQLFKILIDNGYINK